MVKFTDKQVEQLDLYVTEMKAHLRQRDKDAKEVYTVVVILLIVSFILGGVIL